jgi:hypothetical protein
LAAGELVSSISKTLVAGGALAVLSWACLSALRMVGLPPAVQLVVAGGAGGVTFVAVAWALRSPDLNAIAGQVSRRIGR